MTEAKMWELAFFVTATILIGVISFFCVAVKGYREEFDYRAKLDGILYRIRLELELPTAISFDVLPGAISTLFNEHKRIQKKYLDLKTKWQEIESRTSDTKKVFARALKRWQKAHQTEKVPHLNELVDWLVGDENVADINFDSIMGMVEQVRFAISDSQRMTHKLERFLEQFKQMAEKAKGGDVQ